MGREKEINRASRHLQEVEEKGGGIICISGEQGCGKTLFALHLEEIAKSEGFEVVIDQYSIQNEQGRAFESVLTDLSITESLEPAISSQRFQLRNKVYELMKDKKRLSKMLIVVEDMHLRGTEWFDIIKFLGTKIVENDHKWLIVFTFQDDYMPGQSQSSLFKQNKSEKDRVITSPNYLESIGLHPFDKTAVNKIIDVKVKGVSDKTKSYIWSQSGGIPLVLFELVKHIKSAPRNYRDFPKGSNTSSLFDAHCRRLLKNIDRTKKKYLQIFSSFGERYVSVELFHKVAQKFITNDLVVTEKRLRYFVNKTILSTSNGKYRFSHNVLRTYVYDNIIEVERTQIHQAILDDAMQSPHESFSGPEMGWHYSVTGKNYESAIEYYISAYDANKTYEVILALKRLELAYEELSKLSCPALDLKCNPETLRVAIFQLSGYITGVWQGLHTVGIEFYQKALKIIRSNELHKSEWEVDALHFLSVCQRGADPYSEEAIKNLKNAFKLLKELQKSQQHKTDYNEINRLPEPFGNIPGNLNARKGNIIRDIGLCYELRPVPEITKALRYYNISEAILRSCTDKNGYAFTLQHIGACLRQIKEYERASQYLEKSLEMQTSASHLFGEISCRIQIMFLLHDINKSNDCVNQAYEILTLLADDHQFQRFKVVVLRELVYYGTKSDWNITRNDHNHICNIAFCLIESSLLDETEVRLTSEKLYDVLVSDSFCNAILYLNEHHLFDLPVPEISWSITSDQVHDIILSIRDSNNAN